VMEHLAWFVMGASFGATCSAFYFWLRLRAVLRSWRQHQQTIANAQAGLRGSVETEVGLGWRFADEHKTKGPDHAPD
jgi:hypothetical protein